MNKIKLMLIVLFVAMVSGCNTTEQYASVSERFQDALIFTAGKSVPAQEKQCIYVKKTIVIQKNGDTYSMPAGKYFSSSKNSTGIFYAVPTELVKSSNKGLLSFIQIRYAGIYLNNSKTTGNAFYFSTGIAPRPIRDRTLTSSDLAAIQTGVKC